MNQAKKKDLREASKNDKSQLVGGGPILLCTILFYLILPIRLYSSYSTLSSLDE